MSTPMLSCTACGGLSPARCRACLHCEAPVAPRRFGRLARALIGGGSLVMLMACYGMTRPAQQGPGCADGDHDGVCPPQDCDDGKPTVYPGAEDADGDGVDSNCDGVDGWRAPTTGVATDPAPPTPP